MAAAPANRPAPQLAGVVLAAGASTRLGQPKQLIEWGGQTLLARAVGHALALCNRGVVVVSGAAAIADSLADAGRRTPALRIVHNPLWSQGMGTSVACGVRALAAEPAGHPDGMLVLLCDQPTVTRAELVSLVNLWQTDPQQAAAARYNNTRGVPAILPRSVFAGLAGMTGLAGARQLLATAAGVQELAMPSAGFDVDTPADLNALNRKPAGVD